MKILERKTSGILSLLYCQYANAGLEIYLMYMKNVCGVATGPAEPSVWHTTVL